jgi:hypothetical protein
MTPDNQIEKVWDQILHNTLSLWSPQKQSFVRILVNYQNVKPLIFILLRSFEFDRFLFKRQIQSFIPHMTDSKERYFMFSFFKQQRFYFNLFDVCYFSEIVDVMVFICHVKSAQHFKANRVIMVAMDRKNWQFYFQTGVQEICIFKHLKFERMLFLFFGKHMPVENLTGCEI